MPAEAEKINDTLTNLRIDLAEIKEMLKNQQAAKDDHENRIRALEQARWRWTGIATVLGTVGGTGLSWALNNLNGGG